MDKSMNSFFKLALEKIKIGDYDEAIAICDKAITKNYPVYSITNTNSFDISEWEFFDDISSCEKGISEEKNFYKGYHALSLLFKIAGNTDRRKIFLQKAIDVDITINRIWRDFGETSFQMGNVRDALQKFQEAIALDQDDSISFEGVGLCYYYLDEPFKSLTPLKRALKLDPKNHAIMNNLAFILSEIGDLDEAGDIIKKAIELHNKSNVYWDTYASILFLQDKHEESLKIFEKLLENDPKDWEISWDILTSIYNSLGLHVKAKIIEEKLHLK
ncbi:MAG: tetratricopeptide repeat protein [Candidatus Heimdallarchaeota archaeon]